MDGFRFFEEYIDDARELSAGNVIAIHIDGESFVQEGGVCFPAFCAASDDGEPNSPVLARLCNAEYLGTRCRHVSEARARAIHPRLFEYLDAVC